MVAIGMGAPRSMAARQGIGKIHIDNKINTLLSLDIIIPPLDWFLPRRQDGVNDITRKGVGTCSGSVCGASGGLE